MAAALTKRRIYEGCLLPSIQAVSQAALRALEESVENYLPHGLTGARREEVLSLAPGNCVPESIIIECVLADSNGTYISHYREAAKKNLKRAGLTVDGTWSAFLAEYWKYLGSSSGLRLVVEQAFSAPKDQDQRKTSTALLLRSAFHEKPLSKHPFKEAAKNSVYFKTLKDLRRSLDAIQRYAYYMRPNDPMNHSPDTAVRLGELLSYVSVLYRWLLWLMDTIDGRVLKAMEYIPSPYGPRECRTPDKLFEKHIRSGPGANAENDCASALTNLTHDALMALLRLSLLSSMADWKHKTSGVMSAIVCALELASLIHHHCQYIINLMLIGNVCWLEKGTNDPMLQMALRNQGRYCHFLGKLAPTASSHSWAQMERSTAAWFKVAIARACVKHGGPTPHFLLSAGGEAYKPLFKAQCDETRSTNETENHLPARNQTTEKTIGGLARSSRRSWNGPSKTEKFLIRVVGGSRRGGSVRPCSTPSLKRACATEDLPSACEFVDPSPKKESYCWYTNSDTEETDFRSESKTPDGSTFGSTDSEDRIESSIENDSDTDSGAKNIYVDMDEMDRVRTKDVNGNMNASTYSICKEPLSVVRARLGPLPPTPRTSYETKFRSRTVEREDLYATPRETPLPKRLSIARADGSLVDYDIPRPQSRYRESSSLYDTPTVYSAISGGRYEHSDDEDEFRSPLVGSISRSSGSKSCTTGTETKNSADAMNKLERVMSRLGIYAHPVDGFVKSHGS